MKFKYFTRGLGVGIIFSAIIMLVAYVSNGSYKLTDDEIKNRAKKLGMVEASTDILTKPASATDSAEAEQNNQDKNNKDDAEDKDTAELTTKATTEANTVTTTEATTEEITTTEATTEATTEETPSELVTATITVTAGMGSYEAALLLQNAGIIEDASDFDAYLNKNGYSTKIRIKSEKFNNAMTYEEIAKLLIKEDE